MAMTWWLRLPRNLLILVVRCYQWLISPWLGRNCRFTPSCSEYMVQSLQRHGLLKGGFRGLLRIGRCHPFHRGGYDPP